MAGEAGEAAAGGEQTFEQEFEAAREAEGATATPAPAEGGEGAEGAEGEAALEGEAAVKAPLAPEVLAKRLDDQKRARSEERTLRRQAEARLKEATDRLTALEAQPGQRQGAAERPDPSEDPIGFMEYVEGRFREMEARNVEERQQNEARERAQAEVSAVMANVREYEKDFAELTPDYQDAVDHIYEAKKSEYVDSGYTDDEAHLAVMQEFLTRANRVMAAGKDPAEVLYALSKKAGYTPKTGAAKLDAIEQGQRRQSPLSGGPSRGGDNLTEASVSKLTGAAFDSAFAKLQERARAMERASGL